MRLFLHILLDDGEARGRQMTDKYLANQRRRTNKARKFMKNTCPASRHVHLMAECLARGEKYFMVDEEPQHVALSMLSVLESLWKLRTETKWPSAKDAKRIGRALDAALKRAKPAPPEGGK